MTSAVAVSPVYLLFFGGHGSLNLRRHGSNVALFLLANWMEGARLVGDVRALLSAWRRAKTGACPATGRWIDVRKVDSVLKASLRHVSRKNFICNLNWNIADALTQLGWFVSNSICCDRFFLKYFIWLIFCTDRMENKRLLFVKI